MTLLTIAGQGMEHAHWGGGGWWPIFPLFWVILWGALIFAFLRYRRNGGHARGRAAEDVLAERYARGEISVEEYRERLDVLRAKS